MAVLFGWSYFFTPPKPAEDNSNTAQQANTAAPAEPTQAPAAAPQQQMQQVGTAPADANPNRAVTIKTDLYEVTLDSKGAVATSWIVLRNKSSKSDYAVFADGSTEGDRKPLQLISQKALQQNPRELPFRISMRSHRQRGVRVGEADRRISRANAPRTP